VSNVHRLKASEKIFFITTNLNLGEQPFHELEYRIIAETIVNERRRLGFLLFGYVLIPDHWHALIWPRLKDAFGLQSWLRDKPTIAAESTSIVATSRQSEVLVPTKFDFDIEWMRPRIWHTGQSSEESEMNAKQLKKFENGLIPMGHPPVFQLDKYGIHEERDWEWAVTSVDNRLMKLQSTPGHYAVQLPTSVIHHTQAVPESRWN
jgi:hypothetical protein